jgi:hypothetical protein
LESTLFSFKLDVLSFPGDQSLVDPFLKRNLGIQSTVDQLKADLLYIDLTKANAQVDLLKTSSRKLQEDLGAFLTNIKGKIDFQVSSFFVNAFLSNSFIFLKHCTLN